MSWASSVVVQLLNWVQSFCDPMDYNPPGSSVLGISQASILEWVAVSFSRGTIAWSRGFVNGKKSSQVLV